MDTAIQVDNLSKRYRINLVRQRYRTLRDEIADNVRALFRRNGRSHQEMETFWALRDVSFEVKHGEVIGIIGSNGAGKSTLLKILSRITEPTQGRAMIHGRVGSLLEVGTGFHGELSGRENIYLNGAMLGMKKAEIDRKFDEIVAFAEIEQFIDTPVKRYSSGMYIRLGFAVAAHLEPEILIIDEVLAVGDVEFQKKCMGKMEGMAREGRTVVFVSHNMAALENLCDTGVVLQHGKVSFRGSMENCVDNYIRTTSARRSETSGQSNFHVVDLSSIPRQSPFCRPLLKRLELYVDGNIPCGGTLKLGGTLIAHISFYLENPTSALDVTLEFDNLFGQRIFAAQSIFQPGLPQVNRVGNETLVCEIPSLTLIPGEYKINVAMALGRTESGKIEDWIQDAARITIVGGDYYGTGKVPKNGLVALQQRWYLQSSGFAVDSHATNRPVGF